MLQRLRPLVTNQLFLEASDFDEAVRIAKTHPGTRYGGDIELRAWALPRSCRATAFYSRPHQGRGEPGGVGAGSARSQILSGFHALRADLCKA